MKTKSGRFNERSFVSQARSRQRNNSPTRKAGIAPEHFKRMDLIAPFAQDLSDAFSQSNHQNYSDANRALDIFLFQCGDNLSAIGDIGLLYGSTLSFTRLGVDLRL